MDQVDILHVGRCMYWSEVLCCTITTHLRDLEVKVMGRWIKLIFGMLVDACIGLKFYALPSQPT